MEINYLSTITQEVVETARVVASRYLSLVV
jgi:hypothetical protein